MIKGKHVLLWFFSLLLCLNISSIALANTTSSQVGIYFTDKIEEEDEDVQNKTDSSNYIGQKSNGTSSYLPQTGENKSRSSFVGSSIGMLGMILLITSRSQKNRKKEQ
ncbi:MAG: LPXTG cell wall anchor domain-containing protein [Carnobacterium maltaromaticum]